MSPLCFCRHFAPAFTFDLVDEGTPSRSKPGVREFGLSVPFQYGKGHTLSFCFPICQSRANPLGSAIRNKIMSVPKIMKLMCSRLADVIARSQFVFIMRNTIGRP